MDDVQRHKLLIKHLEDQLWTEISKSYPALCRIIQCGPSDMNDVMLVNKVLGYICGKICVHEAELMELEDGV